MTPAKLRLAMAAMEKPETVVGELCSELCITRQTLYRHIAPDGTLRTHGRRLLERKGGRSVDPGLEVVKGNDETHQRRLLCFILPQTG
jgi:hypothetical protein